MAITRSISLTIGDKMTFRADSEPVNGNTFSVIIDGNADLVGGFTYDVMGDYWFDIVFEGNEFTINARENFNVGIRTGAILFRHKSLSGENGEKLLTLIQEGITCELALGKGELVLEHKTYDEEIINDIEVTAKGGSENFYVKNLLMFDSEDEPITYDNGIIVSKVKEGDKRMLRITSYGQTFIEDGCYYKIVLAHSDDRNTTATLMVKYGG